MKRFLSLDVFRGMVILLMIVLSNQTGGNALAPPDPAAGTVGSGMGVAGLIFPFFLFIMGSAMWFSTHRESYGFGERHPKSRRIGHILYRTVVLFALGIGLNWLPFQDYFAFVRIPGVLQQIAVTYFFAALIALYLSRRRTLIGAIVILLAGYWFLLDSAGDGVVRQFDELLFQSSHLMRSAFDIENMGGTLTVIPMTATVLIGYLAGRTMDRPNTMSGGISTLMVVGLAFLGIGWLFGLFDPMDGQLWTVSYVLFATGAAMVIWSILSFIIEYMQAQSWCEFFTIAGTNPLFIYCFSTAAAKLFALWGVTQAVYGFYLSYHLPDEIASLMWSLTMVLLCWLITWPLYRMRIFLAA
ncbi:heparan-alpha-glucosaminide N-acetyltransferase domain-containing protein [uncultured Rikenella sp.]|uniref:acyltransferase family protein n=1 Tax=uncultured Rikenella sp. TaxID=368003 RepID=UPI0025D1FF16|nr:heparan-alpha-glucosaminide N-acetyltransferase domain-containing protein [uncultured Rikenella sp.]